MRGLFLAARYLTIVPLPAGAGSEGPPGPAAAWFPVVGLGLGAALVAMDRVTSWVFPPLLSALLVVTAWKVLTGGLHLDGLADCLDGLGGRDPAHRLRIMEDGRIGAFGAIGLVLLLFLEVAAVAELAGPGRWRALLTAPVVGRATPPLLARLVPAARAHGQGAAFVAAVRPAAVPIALGLAHGAATVVLGVAGLAIAAAAVVVAVGVGRLMAARLGGITGDVLGAAVEASELAVLLGAAAWTRLER